MLAALAVPTTTSHSKATNSEDAERAPRLPSGTTSVLEERRVAASSSVPRPVCRA